MAGLSTATSPALPAPATSTPATPEAPTAQTRTTQPRTAGDRSGKGLAIVRAAALTGTIRRASDHAAGALGSERLLPVLPELRALLPGRGLRRGATVAVATVGAAPDAPVEASARRARSTGATSLLLALLAAASGAGSWCAVVGVPTLGAVAAAEAGIALDRLALVPYPGPDWATIVAALLDGVDIVVTAPPGPIAPSTANRLAARARQRGSVLVSYGRWDGADITFDAVRGVWHGLGQGRGRLRCRQLTIMSHGRGSAAAPKRTEVWWPKASGPLAGHLERSLTLESSTMDQKREALRATG